MLGLTHLRIKTKHMRACQEDCVLDSLVLHATGFLFNCVSPICVSVTFQLPNNADIGTLNGAVEVRSG
jgi:hypothetical protein